MSVIGEAERRELTTLALMAGSATLVVLVYFDSFGSMVRAWSDSSHRHGVVVFPIAAFLLWRLRAVLARIDLKPWPPGIALLLALVAVWRVGKGAGVELVEHLAAVLLLPATIATCLGWRVVRQALFPLLFLVMAVPASDVLIPYLMRLTADIAAVLLRGVGVPVYREGQLLSLPGGDFEVADVCSGLNYLIASTLIALLFAYLTYTSNLKRVALVAAMAASLAVVNGVRAFVVMLIASATDMRVFTGADHVYFGWILFAVVVGGVLLLGARYADREPADKGPSAVRRGAGNQGRLLPMVGVMIVVMFAMTAQPFAPILLNTWMWALPVSVLVLWSISSALAPKVAQQGRVGSRGHDPRDRIMAAIVIAVAGLVLLAGPVSANRWSTSVAFGAWDADGVSIAVAASAASSEWVPE